MARLQGVKRIEKNDFPSEFKDIADRIGYAFNSFAEEVVDAFNNKRIGFDNLNRRLMSITTSTDANGIPEDDLIIQPGVVNLQGFNVISAVSNQGLGNPTGAPFFTFNRLPNGTVRVVHITGLPTGVRFNLTVEVIGS